MLVQLVQWGRSNITSVEHFSLSCHGVTYTRGTVGLIFMLHGLYDLDTSLTCSLQVDFDNLRWDISAYRKPEVATNLKTCRNTTASGQIRRKFGKAVMPLTIRPKLMLKVPLEIQYDNPFLKTRNI